MPQDLAFWNRGWISCRSAVRWPPRFAEAVGRKRGGAAHMKFVSRRVTVGALSAAVVVTMAGVSTWALADEAPARPVRLIVGLKANAPLSMTAAGTVSSLGVRSMDAAGPAQLAMSKLRAHTMEVSAS